MQTHEGHEPMAAAGTMTKLPGTLTLIKETLSQFAKSWKTYLALSALPIASFMALAIPGLLYAVLVYSRSGGLPSIPVLIILGIYGVAFIVTVSIISILSYTAIYAATAMEDRASFKVALHGSKQLAVPLLWIGMLVSLAIFGGSIFFFIPGIIVVVSLILAQYLLVVEKKHGLSALAESGALIKGYWWAVLGRGILLWIITMIAYYLPVAVIAALPVADNVQGGILSIYGNLASLIISPLWIILLYRVYKHLRMRKPVLDAAMVKQKETRYRILAWIGTAVLILALFAPLLFVSSRINSFSF